MIGSLLSNLLLVLGMCFFLGGLKYKFQVSKKYYYFNLIQREKKLKYFIYLFIYLFIY